MVSLILALLSIGVLTSAQPAEAHARLVSTDPADGSRLRHPPAMVAVTFGSTVLISAGSLRVTDRRGQQVQSGPAFHPGGVPARVAVRLPAALPEGSYIARFGVLSDDGHPVSGAFPFVVGTGPLIEVGGTAVGDTGASPAVGLLAGAARWLSLCGLAVLGGVFIIPICWPAGAVNTRARRLLAAGWVSAVTGSVLNLLLLGPQGSGLGVTAIASPEALAATVGLPVGKVLVLRLLALLALAPLAVWLITTIDPGGRDRRRTADSPSLAVALLVLIGYSGAGHAESGPQPTAVVLSDLAHVASMTVWLGGLVMVTLVLLPQGSAQELAAALPRFSRLALIAVAVLSATGSFQAWQQVRSWPLLWQTGYGQILLLKLLAVGVIILAARRSRSIAHRPRQGPQPATEPVSPNHHEVTARPVSTEALTPNPVTADPLTAADRHHLRTALLIEVLASIVVLLLSSILIASMPPRIR